MKVLGIYSLVPTPAGYTHLYYRKDGDQYISVPHEFSNAERQAIQQVETLYYSVVDFYALLQSVD